MRRWQGRPILMSCTIFRQTIDQNIYPHVNAGAYAIGGPELGHPDKHVDAQFLSPGHVEAEKPVLEGRHRDTHEVAAGNGNSNDDRCSADEEGDDPFLKVIEIFQHGGVS